MKAFVSSHRTKQRLQESADRAARGYDPTPDRTNSERMRIRRALDGIKERLQYWLDETEYKPLQWMPWSGIITEKSEEHSSLCKDFYGDSAIDEFGYMSVMHDSKQRATNKVTVSTWYVNELDQAFYVVKVIHSPIPCPDWGWMPLSRKHWNVVIVELMNAHQLWQWVHAVREYTNDDTFQVQGTSIVGWYMERARHIYTKDYQPCTGQVIYRHIIQKFFDARNGT